MKLINNLICSIVLIFSLQSLTKADDIREFEIEGMSVGDSLLDYMSRIDIDKADTQFYSHSKKFEQKNIGYEIKMETYDFVTVALKTNDENYTIHEIKGFKRFSSHRECLTNRDIVVKELKNLFNKNEYNMNSYEKKTEVDKYSNTNSVDFIFDSGLIRAYCIDWSKKIREDKGGFYDDSLTVIIYDKEFQSFLSDIN
tara:strand:+ start:47 stop:640 length:594 start_codon:yes stop_codon:yes gene_type:complete